jgi:hypothetical protein
MLKEQDGVAIKDMMVLTQMAGNIVTRIGLHHITNSNVQIHTPETGHHAIEMRMHMLWVIKIVMMLG